MATNDDTVIPSEEENKANRKAIKEQEKQQAIQEKQEADRVEREAKVDNEVATRTSRYDQDLKERARNYGINPDNFATEEELGATVKKYEDDNGILGTPEERDQ